MLSTSQLMRQPSILLSEIFKQNPQEEMVAPTPQVVPVSMSGTLPDFLAALQKLCVTAAFPKCGFTTDACHKGFQGLGAGLPENY